MHLIYDGMGDKVATFVQWTTTFVVSFVIAFISGWKLALATVAFCPLIILVGGTLTRVSVSLTRVSVSLTRVSESLSRVSLLLTRVGSLLTRG